MSLPKNQQLVFEFKVRELKRIPFTNKFHDPPNWNFRQPCYLQLDLYDHLENLIDTETYEKARSNTSNNRNLKPRKISEIKFEPPLSLSKKVRIDIQCLTEKRDDEIISVFRLLEPVTLELPLDFSYFNRSEPANGEQKTRSIYARIQIKPGPEWLSEIAEIFERDTPKEHRRDRSVFYDGHVFEIGLIDADEFDRTPVLFETSEPFGIQVATESGPPGQQDDRRLPRYRLDYDLKLRRVSPQSDTDDNKRDGGERIRRATPESPAYVPFDIITAAGDLGGDAEDRPARRARTSAYQPAVGIHHYDRGLANSPFKQDEPIPTTIPRRIKRARSLSPTSGGIVGPGQSATTPNSQTPNLDINNNNHSQSRGISSVDADAIASTSTGDVPARLQPSLSQETSVPAHRPQKPRVLRPYPAHAKPSFIVPQATPNHFFFRTTSKRQLRAGEILQESDDEEDDVISLTHQTELSQSVMRRGQKFVDFRKRLNAVIRAHGPSSQKKESMADAIHGFIREERVTLKDAEMRSEFVRGVSFVVRKGLVHSVFDFRDWIVALGKI